MNKNRTLGNILFWLTLISPMVSLALASIIGEVDIFGIAGIIRYSWVMLLFVPIGILSILIGIKLKYSMQKYRKNLIVSFICVPLLIIFGLYRFIFSSVVSYDVNEVSIIEEKINFEIPDDIEVATNKLDLYNISYVKIIDSESKDAFEQEIRNNQLWQKELKPEIKGLLPLAILYETEVFEYFVFFNVTSNEYNTSPLSGQNECIFIAYDCDLQRLMIVDDYKININ